MNKGIIIEGITIQNFKGIRSLRIDFGGTTTIYGTNEAGKTTIFDAFLWCLFGKDSQNSASFDIKPLDEHGNPAHNLEHSVGVSLNAKGQPVTLKKVYAEKWTKKRGTASPEFSGHTTDHFFNGVPVKEKEYQERLKAILDESVFRLVTDPRYFNEVLHWQEKRRILMGVCGDVSNADVIASNSKLSGLTAMLNGNNIEDYKKIIAAKKKEINDQLQKIPVRIDEATRSMMDVRSDIALVSDMIKSLEEKKAGLESQLADMRNGGAISKKRIELQEITAEIQQQKNAFEHDKGLLIAPLNKDLDALQDKQRTISSRISSLSSVVSTNKADIDAYERELATLRDKWMEIDGQEISISTCCPTCGQALPEDQISSAREKFQNAKAEQLAGIDARGKERKAKIEEFKSRVDEASKEMAALVVELDGIEASRKGLMDKIADLRAQTPDTSALEEKKASVQAEIDNIAASEQGLVIDLQGKILEVKTEVDSLNSDLRKAEANTATEQRIIELENQEKALAKQYEEIEGSLCLVEDFIRAKVELLEGKINSKFDMARFKLFSDQINGGLTEVCETTLKGVPYGSVNNAGRIQVGMDIIKTLQAHYGMTAPVWIDNRESIVEIPAMDCQTISLVVSEQDKNLRIEKEA